MHISNYIKRFTTLRELIHERNSESRETEEPLSPACEDPAEADLLRIVTFLMGDSAKRSGRWGEVRDLIAGLIGHAVVERGATSAPLCLHLVREIVATPGDAFAGRLVVIGARSRSAFIKETLEKALSASRSELAFIQLEALVTLPLIEAALSRAADYTPIVHLRRSG